MTILDEGHSRNQSRTDTTKSILFMKNELQVLVHVVMRHDPAIRTKEPLSVSAPYSRTLSRLHHIISPSELSIMLRRLVVFFPP